MMKQRVEKYSRIAYYRAVTLSGPNDWSFLDGFLIASKVAYSPSRQHKLSLRGLLLSMVVVESPPAVGMEYNWDLYDTLAKY